MKALGFECTHSPPDESRAWARRLRIVSHAVGCARQRGSFRERCLKNGLSQELLERLLAVGSNTFGKLAFAASSTPQGLTDGAVDSWLATVITPAPSAFQVSVLRRLSMSRID